MTEQFSFSIVKSKTINYVEHRENLIVNKLIFLNFHINTYEQHGIKKNFYAIAKGNRPGIYDNWPQAHNQVKGFPGALYKGFATRQEAEAWLENPHYSLLPRPQNPLHPRQMRLLPQQTVC